MDVGAVSIWRDPRKSTMWCDSHICKAICGFRDRRDMPWKISTRIIFKMADLKPLLPLILGYLCQIARPLYYKTKYVVPVKIYPGKCQLDLMSTWWATFDHHLLLYVIYMANIARWVDHNCQTECESSGKMHHAKCLIKMSITRARRGIMVADWLLCIAIQQGCFHDARNNFSGVAEQFATQLEQMLHKIMLV